MSYMRILLLSMIFFLVHTYQIKAQESNILRSEIIKSVSYRQVKGDKLVVTDSIVMQINNRMGDNDAEIFIPYSKGDKVSIGDTWIEDLSGEIIRKLNKKEIVDRSSISEASLYQDDFVKSFELKHNQYPYRIVTTYQITYSKFISIASFDCSNTQQSIRNGKLIVETPYDKHIKYKQENTTPPQIYESGNIIQYIWDFEYDNHSGEVNSPYTLKGAPAITVVPLNFNYGKLGSWESWKSFGDWIFQLNDGKDILPVSETQRIDEMLEGITGDKEKTKVLYYYLQDNHRYINVKIDIGGLQAYPAEYVCKNRYGDCKALTNYMKAMLNYVGIQSYYTLINMGDKVEDIDLQFPSQAFNHVILTVPMEEDTLYLECTTNNLPFGYIHTSIQNRRALLIDQNNSRIINIPALSPNDVICSQKSEIAVNPSSLAYAKMNITQRGRKYEESSYLVSNVSKENVDKYFKNNILSGTFDLSGFGFEKFPRDSAQISLRTNCSIYNICKAYGNNIIINPFTRKMLSYEKPGYRTQPVQLDYPEYYSDTIMYNIYKDIKRIPEAVKLHTPYGSYSLTFYSEGRQLVIYKKIMINSGRYDLNEYDGFYQFIQSIKNNENRKIYIETL